MTVHHNHELVMTRIFDAPRERLWQAWSEPEKLKKWWGPKVFSAPSSTIDFRVGGKYLHCMRAADGKEYWSTGTYKEIKSLQRIVATDSFADQHGHVVPASYYGMDNFPTELQLSLEFNSTPDGKTHMTLRHRGLPNNDMIKQCKTGWSESFDKLAACLK